MAAGTSEADSEPVYSRVADPEEFNQTERLRAINEVRKQAGETIQATMTQLRTDAQFDVSDRQQILRAAVMRYLTNIEWLAHQAENDELLYELHLGDVAVEPPEYMQQLVAGELDTAVQVVGAPNLQPRVWSINGINGYLTAPETFTGQWAITLQTRHNGPTRPTETRSSYMPAHVSFNAFRMANRFLAEQGIDIELSEDDRDGEFDYADILEEGPPGKRDPPEMVNGGDD